MISDRKLEANRRNARLSKGPKTPEGKAAVRFNALKHGLAAEHLVLQDEEQQPFDELLSAYLAEHQPQGPTETDLVHQLVTGSWRLRRLRTMETGLFELRLIDDAEDLKEDYTGLRTQERLAYVFAQSAEKFNILARYEARIERSFYRALHEIQRLKAGRAGQPVPPPQVIEINAPENPEPTPQTSGNSASQPAETQGPKAHGGIVPSITPTPAADQPVGQPPAAESSLSQAGKPTLPSQAGKPTLR